MPYDNFDSLVTEVRKMIYLLSSNLNVFNWRDFGGNGNHSWNPHIFSNDQERKEDALMLAAVKVAIPYGSQAHHSLSAGIAKEIGILYCTYPWLLQAIAYALKDIENITDLKNIINAINILQAKMKAKGP